MILGKVAVQRYRLAWAAMAISALMSLGGRELRATCGDWLAHGGASQSVARQDRFVSLPMSSRAGTWFASIDPGWRTPNRATEEAFVARCRMLAASEPVVDSSTVESERSHAVPNSSEIVPTSSTPTPCHGPNCQQAPARPFSAIPVALHVRFFEAPCRVSRLPQLSDDPCVAWLALTKRAEARPGYPATLLRPPRFATS